MKAIPDEGFLKMGKQPTLYMHISSALFFCRFLQHFNCERSS